MAMEMTNEEAIKQMEEFMVIDDWSLVYLPDLHDALEIAIKALKRPHGKWVFKNDNMLIPTGYWECSICKKGRLMVEENFCPSCGAPMTEDAFRKYNGLECDAYYEGDVE